MTNDAVTAWVLIGGLALVSFVTRAALVLPGERVRLSPTVERILRFAPAAALAAIILPDLFRPDSASALGFVGPRLIAGTAAFVAAAITRNILVTIAVGMVVLLLVR
jgi:branched-subunit amino acid transport protein